MGYNSNGSSNFVKDFSFQTKITPNLMAMISIGATAEGSSTKDIDAIPFKKWNDGLDNRFEETYFNPSTSTDPSDISDEDKKIRNSFESDLRNKKINFDWVFGENHYDWEYDGKKYFDIAPLGETLEGPEKDFNNKKVLKVLLDEVVDRVNSVRDKQKAKEGEIGKKIISKDGINSLPGYLNHFPDSTDLVTLE